MRGSGEKGDLDGHNDINDTNDMQTGSDGDGSNSSAAHKTHKTAHRTRLKYACICLSAPFHNNHRFITRGMQVGIKLSLIHI